MPSSGRVTIEPSLAWLLHPLAVETFLNEIWAERHYHLERRCAGYFDDLLPGPSAGEELLRCYRRTPSAVRLMRGQDKKGPDSYRLVDDTLDLARVRDDFADGYTVVLDGVEEYARDIGSLARSIEVELNYPTQVNAYISPPASQGLVAHYDDHDLLVLQIEGSKIWHLYDGADVSPHELQRKEKSVATDGLPRPTDLRLEAGDMLYLPRGRVHAAETESEPSIHLTVGVHAPTVLLLAVGALHRLSSQDDRLNARLPPRHLDDAEAQATLGILLRDALKAVEGPSAVAGGLDALADVLVRRGRCPPVGQISDATTVDGQSLVRKHHPLYSWVTTVAGGVALHFARLSIPASSDHEDALLFLSRSSQPFRVHDLPGLAPAQQTELARTLIVSGFLARLT
ncbi:MAG: cupin domain-containing protein [Mycobacterium sp.]|uniref:cupin domain-containing protein n=1 Tax=Mycobacterium sp. TaxID=1785 RepID=UPI003CC60D00